MLIALSACSLNRESSINNTDLDAREVIGVNSPKTGLSSGHKSSILALFPNKSVKSGQFALYSADRKGELLGWDSKLSKAYKLFQLKYSPDLACYSSTAGLLGFASSRGLEVYSLSPPKLIGSLRKERLKSKIVALDFDSQAHSLLIGAADGRIYQWNFRGAGTSDWFFAKSESEREKELQSYIGHSTVVSAVVFHPQAQVFFSADWSGAIFAWLPYDSDRFSGFYDKSFFGDRFFAEQVVKMRGAQAGQVGVEQLRVSSDGEFLLAAYQDGTLELWKVRGFKRVYGIKAHQGLIYDLALDATGKKIASVSRDGSLKIWELQEIKSDSAQPSEYSLQLMQEASMPEVRRLAFIAPELLVLGAQNGSVSTFAVGK